jgi:hypothetical protein
MSGLEALLAQQVIGLNEAIDDRTAALLVAGTGITLTYNDGAGTLTIANTGLGGSTGSTDNRILRSDGTGGATVQNSAVTIDDNGNISGLGTVACGAITASGNIALTGSNPQVGFGGSGGAGFPYVEHSSGALNLGHTYATVLAVGSNRITCQQPFQLRAYTVATLPSAATHAGRWVQVTDSSVTTNGSIVAGGGSNRVPLFSDGTNWIVK